MSPTLIMAKETLTLLRRDKIFAPSLITGVFLIFLTSVISEFTIAEMAKIYLELAFTMFNFTGSTIAILWGTKLIIDAKNEGSINNQLAAPIDRSQWLLGKFLGLCAALIIFGVLLSIILLTTMVFNQYASLAMVHIIIVLHYILGWIVLAAIALFFSTFASQGIAIFSTISLWFMGLSVEPIGQVLSDKTNQLSRALVDIFLVVFNLQAFNLQDKVNSPSEATLGLLGLGFGYAATLVGSVIIFSAIIFRNRDID